MLNIELLRPVDSTIPFFFMRRVLSSPGASYKNQTN